jgi:hypothetical protein
MKDKSREQIRQRIIAGRCPHDIVARVIKHSMKNYDYWERAAVTQIMAIYKTSTANACAIIGEMTGGNLRNQKASNRLVKEIKSFYETLDKTGS